MDLVTSVRRWNPAVLGAGDDEGEGEEGGALKVGRGGVCECLRVCVCARMCVHLIGASSVFRRMRSPRVTHRHLIAAPSRKCESCCKSSIPLLSSACAANQPTRARPRAQLPLFAAVKHPGAAALSYLYAPKKSSGKGASAPWGPGKVHATTHWVVVDLAAPRWASGHECGGEAAMRACASEGE
jgi:hypothetical protein